MLRNFAPRPRSLFAPLAVAALLPALLLPTTALASQVEVKFVDSYRALAAGTFEDAALTPDGTVHLGRVTTTIAKDITGPVLDMAEHQGATYVAVAAPPRVMRVREGKAPEVVVTVDTGLITSLVSFGKHLVGFTAPDGGAIFINTKAKKVAKEIKLPDVKMILDAAVLGNALYVVGGGDAGILATLPKGGKAFEVLTKTKEAHLRSIAADARRKHLIIGGGDDGVIYRYDTKIKDKKKRLQALYDAAPEETTSLSIDDAGRIFATFVDAKGKLSSGATKRDKSDEATKKKESKPRKIKSSEVVRIDPTGAVHILWQSKVDGAFSSVLADGGKRLLVGTGAGGKIFDIDPSGRAGAAVVARAKGFDEVTVLKQTKLGLLGGTAHSGGVIRIENKKAKRGVFTTAPLSASTIAKWGRLSVDHHAPAGTWVKWSIRTGNTNDPDQTWSAFSPALIHSGNPIVDRGKYMQVRVEMAGNGTSTPHVRSIRAAYLEENRPPEIDRIDVVLPNFKVVATPKEKKTINRSVTFGDGAFKKFIYAGGSPLPKLGDRTSGKQTENDGWRTVFAFAEDPDKDQLRFQWWLTEVDSKGAAQKWKVAKEWSDEPFYSFDTNRFNEGKYRFQVEVTDLPSNGPDRNKSDSMTSADITVSKRVPTISGASARRMKTNAVRIRFQAKASVPLRLAECSVGDEDWIPIDSLDGLVDGEEERFETILDGNPRYGAVACAVTDELGHRTTVAIETP